MGSKKLFQNSVIRIQLGKNQSFFKVIFFKSKTRFGSLYNYKFVSRIMHTLITYEYVNGV